jgi:hypothetical protein
MDTIAEDEIRHAELAWDIGRWIDRQLTTEEREQVARAARDAVARLRETAAHDSGCPELGLPAETEAQALLDRAEQALWRAA